MLPNRYLFLIRTPLQAKIAAQVMDGLRCKEADCRIEVLFVAPQDNVKTRHYFQVASKWCERAFFCEYRDGRKWGKQTARHFARLFSVPYQTVFLASVDDFVFRTLLPKLTFSSIETFDDGSKNLLPDSSYRENASWWKRWRRQLRGEWTTDIIRNRSRRHHTVYPGMSNIVVPTVAVDLWQEPAAMPPPLCRTVRKLMIGQPILGEDANIGCRDRLIGIFRPDAYFPHPAEANLPNLPVIETDLIVEDYIERQLQDDSGLCFEIATFFSSAALHLYRHPRIKVRAYRAAGICKRYPLFDQVYPLMEQMGVDVIDLDGAELADG